MSKIIIRILFSTVFAILAVVTSGARASAAAAPSGAELHVASFAPIAFVEGAAPRHDRARGTAIVAWIASGDDGAELVLAEWDVARNAKVRQRSVAKLDGHTFGVALIRAGGGLFALVSGLGADRAPTTLFAIDDMFMVKTKLDFAEGGAPSLDGDDRYVVAATLESRAPTLPVRPSSDRRPPDGVLVARVIERATMTIVGARVFRGPHMFRAATTQSEAGSTVRVVGGRAFFGLPDDEPVVVATRLPSLATIARRELPRLDKGTPTAARLTRLRDGVLVATSGSVHALGPSLEPRGHVDGPTLTSASFEARTGKLLTDVPLGNALAGATASTPKPGRAAPGSVVAWIFGRAIAFAPDAKGRWKALAR